jgi:formamidopyrimidine-DNA glycosylase
MPELPEVETIVRQIRPALVGRRVQRVRLGWAGVVQRPSARAFRSGVAGRLIETVGRRGKYFLLGLDDGRWLVGHLRMTGRLYLQGTPGQDVRPEWLRAVFELDDDRRLVFADVRKFGRLALVDDPADALPPLGPEPLSSEVDGEWMKAALASRRRQLKPLLLDQSFLAGLGNIYVDESLHMAGLHPLRLSHRVPGERAARLADTIRQVLRTAIGAGGSSFDGFYRTPEGRPGRYQEAFRVYGREGRPCRGCGRPIRRIVVGQRGTHLCTRCQPAPRSRR